MKTQWIEQKRKFLSDFFLSNKKIIPQIHTDTKDQNDDIQKNIYTSSLSWNELLTASKKINCVMVAAPREIYKSGLKCDNSTAQLILDAAFEKKIDEFIYENETLDEDTIIESLIEFIYMNRLHHKVFEYTIKKIRIASLDVLPNIF